MKVNCTLRVFFALLEKVRVSHMKLEYTAHISKKVVGKTLKVRDKTEGWFGYSLNFAYWPKGKGTSLQCQFARGEYVFPLQEAFICSFTLTIACLIELGQLWLNVLCFHMSNKRERKRANSRFLCRYTLSVSPDTCSSSIPFYPYNLFVLSHALVCFVSDNVSRNSHSCIQCTGSTPVSL